MMQSAGVNPQLMARLMQLRQGMSGGGPAPNMAPNPGQAGNMMGSIGAPMGNNPSAMTMGQPSPDMVQQILRRRMMMGNQQPQPGMSMMGNQPPNFQPGMSSLTPR